MEITIDFGTLPDLPWDIPPGGRVAFFANYEPLDLIDDITQIDVASNDPETPITDASIFGAAVLSNEQTDSSSTKDEPSVSSPGYTWIILLGLLIISIKSKYWKRRGN